MQIFEATSVRGSGRIIQSIGLDQLVVQTSLRKVVFIDAYDHLPWYQRFAEMILALFGWEQWVLHEATPPISAKDLIAANGVLPSPKVYYVKVGDLVRAGLARNAKEVRLSARAGEIDKLLKPTLESISNTHYPEGFPTTTKLIPEEASSIDSFFSLNEGLAALIKTKGIQALYLPPSFTGLKVPLLVKDTGERIIKMQEKGASLVARGGEYKIKWAYSYPDYAPLVSKSPIIPANRPFNWLWYERQVKILDTFAKAKIAGVAPLSDVFLFRDKRGIVKYGMFQEEMIPFSKCRESREWSLETKLLFVKKLLETLAHIHAEHITHSDVNGNNILLRKGSEDPLLTDFGHAWRAGVDKPNEGVLLFRSLRWWEDPKKHEGARQDLWSVGCLLYELLMGAPIPWFDIVNRVVTSSIASCAEECVQRVRTQFLAAHSVERVEDLDEEAKRELRNREAIAAQNKINEGLQPSEEQSMDPVLLQVVIQAIKCYEEELANSFSPVQGFLYKLLFDETITAEKAIVELSNLNMV